MDFFIYLGKVSLGLCTFYALFWVALRHHTYFWANRLYLLAVTVLSLGIPFVTFTEVLTAPTFWPQPMADLAKAMPVGVAPGVSISKVSFHWELYVAWLYGLGLAWMLLRLGWRLGQVLRLIASSPQTRAEGFTLVLLSSTQSSFSFFHYLAVRPQDSLEAEGRPSVVVAHELVHIRQRHSWDLLWIELLRAFLWFNPILFFYQKSLKQIHEFMADDLATHGDRLGYAHALAGYALGVSPQTLTHSFFHHSELKLRIAMLTQTRSSRRVLSRYLLLLPLLGVLVGLLAARQIVYAEVIQEEWFVKGKITNIQGQGLAGASVVVVGTQRGTFTDKEGRYQIKATKGEKLAVSFVGFKTEFFEILKAEHNQVLTQEIQRIGEIVVVGDLPAAQPVGQAVENTSEEVFTIAERMPSFEGGTQELNRYLLKNLRYPASARRAKVEGFVMVGFIVGEDGYVRQPTVIQSIGFGCEEEALRLILNMPRWQPGMQQGHPVAVAYNLAVNFVLEPNQSAKYSPPVLPESNLPLWLLDGVEINSSERDKLDLNTILEIDVIKVPEALTLYGEKGRNGVVKMTTKPKKP
jgi:TonB family protein